MASDGSEPKPSPEDHPPRATINPPVFFTSAGLLLLFLVVGSLFPKRAGEAFKALLDGVTTSFGWFYLLVSLLFMVFALAIAVSPAGKVTLGREHPQPDFPLPTWFAMLFSAGMGIGLLFYGVAEPMMHYAAPPSGAPLTEAAADQAMAITFFHWGLHAWGIYAVIGLCIAWFAHVEGEPFALRSCFRPLLKDKTEGWIGHLIDILAVFGTLFGLATSLGVGATQVNAGLAHLFGVPETRLVQVVLIAVITGAATISLLSGVGRGIRRLSELNLIVAAILLLFVFVLGPTGHLVSSLLSNIGNYASGFFTRTFPEGWTDPGGWLKGWTLFYWGWWIAWAPFVGMFIARVSRGRTVREFVLGVLFAPVATTFVWFTVFGNTALYIERTEGGISEAVKDNVATSIYALLDHLPLSSVTAMVAALVVTIFFITSSDSASFVVDMLTSGGHPNPPKWQRVFWATAEGSVAAVLLVVSGKEGLTALQSAVIAAAAPFSIVMVAMCGSLVYRLRQRALLGELAPSPSGSADAEGEAPPTQA